MKDIVNSYLFSLDPIEETDVEETDPITEAQATYNQLNERFVALKALTETLKDQIESEKQLWSKELEETIKLEQELIEKHTHEEGHNQKIEIFRDFLAFCRASNHIDTVVKRNNYRSWLSEVDSQCEHELEKIKENLTALKPLKRMMSTWIEDKPCQLPSINYTEKLGEEESIEVIEETESNSTIMKE